MSAEEKSEQLIAAMNLVLEVKETFKNEKSTCECCGMTTFISWNEKQIIDQLKGVINQLDKLSKRLIETKDKIKK